MPADPNQAGLARLSEELEEELCIVHAPRDHCLVSPWLLLTGWHTYVESLNLPMECVCQLVALPCSHSGDIKALSAAVEIYFQGATLLIDSTDELVLQRLNLPNPGKQ